MKQQQLELKIAQLEARIAQAVDILDNSQAYVQARTWVPADNLIKRAKAVLKGTYE